MSVKAFACEPELPEAARSGAAELAEKLQGLGLAEWAMVERALRVSSNAHAGQLRKSGEPYVTHPIQVALLAAQMGLDAQAVSAALLHDVVEDTLMGIGEIEEQFGKEVASMVDALTKIEAIKSMPGDTKDRLAKAETLRKMMLAMSRDIRVILIKLCDRLHNLRTIDSLSAAKRSRIAGETRDIYAPIASRLGLNSIWNELMELSFHASHPWRQRVISAELERTQSHRRNYIQAAVERVKSALLREGIQAEVSGRRKRAHSVYQKMCEKKLRFCDVHDRDGFRVVVDSKSKCYMAIGVLHELWKPMPGYFKDYIAIPKINGYQSIHTALVNELGDPMEAQVRTQEMHARAEDGIASHWIYKSKDHPELAKDAWGWLQSLLDIQASSSHAEDYLEHIKTDLFSDEVYIFTPAGAVIALPRGASALDFAFGIHSDVGMKAIGAKIGPDEVGLSRRLRSGDIVFIQTAAEVQAVPMWLAFAKSGRARSHIRSYLRAQELPKVAEMGKDLLLQSLFALGAGPEVFDKVQAWAKASKRFGGERVDILAKMGRGALSALAVAQVLAKGSKSARDAGGLRPILIGGEESENVRMATCCSPLPPQLIVGALSEEGLAVHRKGCANMDKVISKGHQVEVAWEEAALTQSFSASIKIRAKNERGALGRLAALVASLEADVNNVRVSGNSVGEDRAVIDIDIQVRSKFHLDRVVEGLSKDDSVINVF